jgi:hypothetical protein
LQDEFNELNKMKQGDMTGEQIDKRAELKQQLEELKNNSKRTQIKEQLSNEVFGLAKGSRLAESYNEKARRGQTFEADLSKYDIKQQEVIKKAVESGILNNTNRTHEFVDMVAKISADKGVSFDFTNNEKLKTSGFAVEGKTVNGYVTSDGNIAVNIDSGKSLNSIVGHEITHILEGTELYTALQQTITEYAKTKGEYQSRYDALAKLYEGVEGANIDNELVADLVGDYLFTDADFINSLSTENPNLFKRIYNEIKYLCKIATAGSKEARELEKVKRAFDKAYKESGKAKGDTKYSLTDTEKIVLTQEQYKQMETHFGTTQNYEVAGWLLPNGNMLDFSGKHWGNTKSKRREVDHREIDEVLDLGQSQFGDYIGFQAMLDNGNIRLLNTSHGGGIHINATPSNEQSFTLRGYINHFDGDILVDATDDSGNRFDMSYNKGTSSSKILADIKNFYKDGTIPKKSSEIGTLRYSLTAEQENYFKDSKVRDENGDLKVMYHGTSKGGHTVFDTYGSNYGLFGQGSYFTDNKDVAESYTNKGKGDNKQVYETYLNITNPIDMDAQADVNAWAKALPDADFSNCTTNEDCYRAMEEYFEDEGYYHYEASESAMDVIQSMGYDGITHIGGGRRTGKDETSHRVYIAFEPEQIKNIDNIAPTKNADIRYSLSDSDGNGAIFNGKPFWSGSVSLIDGVIEEVHSYKEAEASDFHHSYYFSQAQAEKIDSGENGFFFVENGKIQGEWRDTVPKDIINKIEEQIVKINPDIRYSISEDSEGNKLTEKQSEYFKESKAVDRNGNLLKVYHTTKNDFTVFDKARKGEATEDANTYLGFFFTDDAEYMQNFPEFENGKTESYYLDMKNPIDMTDISREAFMDIVEVMGGDVGDASILFDEELEDAHKRAKLRGDNNVSLQLGHLLDELTGEFYYDDFIRELQPHYDELMSKGYDGVINYMDELFGVKEYIVLDSHQAKLTSNTDPTADADIRYSISTEKTPFAKTVKTTTPTNANLQKDMFTVRDVRNKTMIENNYTQDDVKQINKFMDKLATFMEKAGVTYRFIGLEDVNNAKVKVVYDRDGTPKRITMSAMVKNGDYPVNFDLTSICKKRQSMSMVIQELASRKNADGTRALDEIELDADALWTINEELRKAGLETACLGCFVESKRYNIQNFSNKATTMWNNIVDEVRREQGKTQPVESFNFAEGVDLDSVDYMKVDEIFKAYNTEEGRSSPEARMRALIKNGGEIYQRYLHPSDIMTPEGIEGLKALSTKKNDFYGIIKGVYGQAAPKEVMGFSPYNSEIALLPNKKGNRNMSEYIASIGGVRMQSFSDFLVSNVYDYMQMVADLSARHLPAHAYTKEIAFAKIFGMTGIKINMSVMFDIDSSLPNEYAGLQFVPDANGDEIYNGIRGRFEYLVGDQKRSDEMLAETGERTYVQSIGFDEAVELQNTEGYSGNIGIIGVGFSDKHIIKMLGDNNIRYVIPYHSSSLPTVIKDVTNIAKATDYTNDQNTRTEDGEALVGLGGFDIYKDVEQTQNPKETAQNYLKYCEKNKYTPVFSQFAWHENYYKLLFDFDPYDTLTGEYSPQTEVKNIYKGYNAEEGLTSTTEIEKIIDDEMAMQNEINRQRNAKLPSVVDSVLEQLGVSHDKVGFSLSAEGETFKEYGNFNVYGKDFKVQTEDIAPTVSNMEKVAPMQEPVEEIAPTREYEAIEPNPDGLSEEEVQWAKNKMARADKSDAENKPTKRSDLHHNIMEGIKTKFTEKGFDFDKVLSGAKNLSTFATVDNIPQRVMEKALGYKQGQILADETVNKVAQNESEGIKWLNSFTDRKNGLLKHISKQYGIKPGSKESAAAQMYAEGFYVNENNDIIEYGEKELAIDFPNATARENIKGLANDPRIRQIYDETLARINESRKRNAYPEIPRLDNYFLHFRAMEDTFSKLGLPFNPNDIRAKDLPTDLNGVTADLKPGQPYFASAMHRTGKRTSFDLLGGLERYLSSAKNQIYHIDDIQTLRALRNYIADTYGQAKGLESIDNLSEEEAQERIKQIYGSHLSTFAKFLNEEANVLAGKTTLIDRGLEGIIGRRGITFLDTINKQVGSNMVGFNISSSLTNFLPVVQTFAKTNKFDFTKAFTQTVAHKVGSIFGKTDSFVENNPTIIRRKGAERFYRTPFQKVGDAGYLLMSAVDDISTELIVRTKYNELIRKGMDEQKASFEADKWVSRLMGDRSLGQQPQLYNSKMLGLFTKFQLEVRNQLDSQFYDTIQEAKVSNEEIENTLLKNAKIAAKVGSTFFQLAVLQHLFGTAFESVAGYNPAFDIIEVLIKTFGLDDDEEDEDTVLDNIEQGFLTLLEDLPYTSTLTGGRIPISSALPIKELVTGEDSYGGEVSRGDILKDIAPYYVLPTGYGQIKKSVKGLKMFDKDNIVSGSYTDSGDLRFPVEDNLKNRIQAALFGQYANENAREYFDNEYAPLKEEQIQEYADVGMPIADYWEYREGLKKFSKQDEKAAYINGLNITEEQKNVLKSYLYDEKGYKEENPEKYAFLESEGIGFLGYKELDDETQESWSWAFKHQDEYRHLKENGVYPEDYSVYRVPMLDFDDEGDKAYEWSFDNPEKATIGKVFSSGVKEYRQYTTDLYNIKADKDSNGNSISGSRKKKVINYINNLDIDYGAKCILIKKEYEAEDRYNDDIVDYLNSRDDISSEEMTTILEELGATVDDEGYIYW